MGSPLLRKNVIFRCFVCFCFLCRQNATFSLRLCVSRFISYPIFSYARVKFMLISCLPIILSVVFFRLADLISFFVFSWQLYKFQSCLITYSKVQDFYFLLSSTTISRAFVNDCLPFVSSENLIICYGFLLALSVVFPGVGPS